MRQAIILGLVMVVMMQVVNAYPGVIPAAGVGRSGISHDVVLPTTNVTIDTNPPVISNVQAVNITNQSSNIQWDTNEVSNSSVNYGTTTALGTFVNDSSLVLSHDVFINNLTSNTTYYYNVTSCDSSGNCATDGVYNFTSDTTNIPSPLDSAWPAYVAIMVMNSAYVLTRVITMMG